MGRVLWVSPSSNISRLSRVMGRHTMAWGGGGGIGCNGGSGESDWDGVGGDAGNGCGGCGDVVREFMLVLWIVMYVVMVV